MKKIHSATMNWKSLDGIGIGLSTICAIHCLCLPVVITLLPLIGLEFLAQESFELGMISVIFATATLAYLRGIRKHGRWPVLTVLLLGAISLLILAHDISESWEPWIVTLGGAMLILGHWLNWQWSHPPCADCREAETAASHTAS